MSSLGRPKKNYYEPNLFIVAIVGPFEKIVIEDHGCIFLKIYLTITHFNS